ncbi:hypothetical protein QYH69_07225 [Paraburkholderia sp. SARCC-3016]|jgi:hypothetical protein|uniref:hypothetical protein n=1 Tax=Paraburkholderia sp. SARCC-3016 TaxID=3058611 RepID=UPI002808BDEA|nr:hypothetical protein [Paraburkholderia sp. SARCC-3016]MDQ7977035.1 hypothetical protein [Paraburkholderia sp. SARCC-3016]
MKMFAATLALISISLNAQVLSPFVQNDHKKVDIGLFSPADAIEINHIDSDPEIVNVDFIGADGNRVAIAEFSQMGSALPDVASVFKGKFKERPLLVLIVKWHFYLPGVDTDADYYEIHVFNVSEHGTRFSRNEVLSRIFGSGFEGRHEGEYSSFKYKNAGSVRKKLHELQ